MLTIVLAVVAVICGIGWLKYYISTCALVYYLQKKGYTPPSDQEIQECARYAAGKIFKKQA